jgi:hypothetical protein
LIDMRGMALSRDAGMILNALNQQASGSALIQ